MRTADEAAAKLREEGEQVDAIIRNIQANRGLVTRQARQALVQPPVMGKKPSSAARCRSRPKAGAATPAAPRDAPDVPMAAGERYIPPHMRTSSRGRAAPNKRAGTEQEDQRGNKYLTLPMPHEA